MAKKKEYKCGMCKGVIFNRKSYAVYCKGCARKLIYETGLIRSRLRCYKILLGKYQGEPKSKKISYKIQRMSRKIDSANTMLSKITGKTAQLRMCRFG